MYQSVLRVSVQDFIQIFDKILRFVCHFVHFYQMQVVCNHKWVNTVCSHMKVFINVTPGIPEGLGRGVPASYYVVGN